MKKIKSIYTLCALFGLILTASVFERTVSANTYYFELFGGSPLLQDWSDTDLITVDDDWSTPLSIQGFRGDGLTGGTGTDPQTLLVDGQLTTPLDVNANETNPDTFATGGVTEFEIADPTIALKGSGTADAPHLMIYLNTTPCPQTKSISISYNVRDIDGSANDAIQQVALHYRIGTTGDFINVPAGYVADATEPDAATKVTPVFANLGHNLIGQTQVELRIMTTNAVGTDEWVGIDDIEVGCYFPTAAAVAVSGRVLKSEGRGLSKARVKIYNTHTLQTKYAVTNPFGFYKFKNLEQGGLHIVTVESKGHTFANNPRAFEMQNDVRDLDFYADPPNDSKVAATGKKR
jgi:hypothetical protein